MFLCVENKDKMNQDVCKTKIWRKKNNICPESWSETWLSSQCYNLSLDDLLFWKNPLFLEMVLSVMSGSFARQNCTPQQAKWVRSRRLFFAKGEMTQWRDWKRAYFHRKKKKAFYRQYQEPDFKYGFIPVGDSHVASPLCIICSNWLKWGNEAFKTASSLGDQAPRIKRQAPGVFWKKKKNRNMNARRNDWGPPHQ